MKIQSKSLLFWLFLLCLSHGLAQEPTAKSDEEKKPEVSEAVVVTASKKPEKRMEAPSTIEVLTEDDLSRSAATTFSGALAQVKGIDFANGGINLQKISTRGFSSSFNSRMLFMVDGRLSTLPGAGLPQGGLAPVSGLDIKSMELILGPAGALYGSNTTAGVLNILTKDPWDESGYSASVKGGQQSLINARIRFAQAYGPWGWKLTGEYLDADEFDSDNVFDLAGNNQTAAAYQVPGALEAALANGLAYREQDLVEDYTTNSQKFELSGYYRGDYAKFTAMYGWSENDGFGVTNVGRNRIEDWEIEHVVLKANADHWFFQYTRTEEDAGDTYAIQSVPAGLAAGLSFDQARTAALFVDKSKLDDYEFQVNGEIGALSLVGGAVYREYDPSSEGSYLDDFLLPDGSRNDISRDETGYYFQADWRGMQDKLRLVAAARYDDFSEFDSQFSPKFGITYQAGAHLLRANYITSYRAPEVIETHLFFFGGLARGNLNGFRVQDLEGNLITTYGALEPEEVTTFEIGYRGLFGNRWFVDALAYSSEYDNFISPLQTIANANFGTVAVAADGEVIPLLLTYLNYGAADIEGVDLGLDVYLNDYVKVKTSVGYQSLKSFENTTTIPDIPFNSPEWKYKAQLELSDLLVKHSFATLGVRSVDAYDYLSGRWAGRIESTTVADLALGINFPDDQWSAKLSWSNATDQDKTELLGTPAVPSFLTFELYKKF